MNVELNEPHSTYLDESTKKTAGAFNKLMHQIIDKYPRRLLIIFLFLSVYQFTHFCLIIIYSNENSLFNHFFKKYFSKIDWKKKQIFLIIFHIFFAIFFKLYLHNFFELSHIKNQIWLIISLVFSANYYSLNCVNFSI